MKPSICSKVLKAFIDNKMPVLLVGAPGVGKSDLVAQAVSALETERKERYELQIFHPVISDPTDFKGMPAIIGDSAHFLPFGDLKALIDAKVPTVAFLDDLGQAPASVQAAAMQLLLARKINGFKISDNVTFVAATNRRQDKAGVQGILEPVKSRFYSIIEVTPDFNDWCDWAIEHDIPPTLIAFVKNKPDVLTGFRATRDMKNSPCPRTLANAGRIVNIYTKDSSGVEDIQKTRSLSAEGDSFGLYEMLVGAAGESFAVEYTGFLRVLDKMPDPDTCIQEPKKTKIPKASEADIRYVLTLSLSYRATAENLKNIVTYLERFEMPEFVITALKTIISIKKEIMVKSATFNECVKKYTQYLI